MLEKTAFLVSFGAGPRVKKTDKLSKFTRQARLDEPNLTLDHRGKRNFGVQTGDRLMNHRFMVLYLLQKRVQEKSQQPLLSSLSSHSVPKRY